MKTSLLLIALSFSLMNFAQIEVPNHDFETWDYYNTWNLEPDQWSTGNFQLYEHVFRDSLAYQGDWAMRVYPYGFFEPYPGQATVYFPIDEIPSTLDFYMKSYMGQELDSVSVHVQLFNNNEMLLDEYWATDETVEEWTPATLELSTIFAPATHAQVTVQASYGSAFLEGSLETWISIDAVSFNTSNSIDAEEAKPYTLSRYGHVLSIQGATEPLTIQLFDLNGKLVQTVFGTELNIDALASGNYILVCLDENQTILKEKVVR